MGGRWDSNPRPQGPQPCALTWLSYAHHNDLTAQVTEERTFYYQTLTRSKQCRKQVNYQYYEAKSGRATNDLTRLQFEPKSRGERWTTTQFPPLRSLVFTVPVSLMSATPFRVETQGGAVHPGFGNPGLDAATPLELTSISDPRL